MLWHLLRPVWGFDGFGDRLPDGTDPSPRCLGRLPARPAGLTDGDSGRPLPQAAPGAGLADRITPRSTFRRDNTLTERTRTKHGTTGTTVMPIGRGNHQEFHESDALMLSEMSSNWTTNRLGTKMEAVSA